MRQATEVSTPKYIWKNIIFFAVTTLVAIIGGPIYFAKFGMTGSLLALTLFFAAATGFGITVGYHRLFSHQTYQAHPIVKFILLFFGAAAFEQSALDWSSQHRDHHRYVDTDKDPYDIKKGFFYAHIGWLIFWEHKINYDNVNDLKQDKLLMHQNKYYVLWAVAAGILTPVLIGALMGQALGAFIFAVCVRLTVVYHGTFCINSVCHMFGKATYDIYSTAKDHWLVALITYGEGYHNFHHRFPSDYRNAVRWYQFDPSKWLIYALSKVGLTWNLKRISKFRIMDAKLAAESQSAQDWVKRMKNSPQFTHLMETLRERQAVARKQLLAWERASAEYKELILKEVDARSKELREAALTKLNTARSNFVDAREQWMSFVKNNIGFAQAL